MYDNEQPQQHTHGVNEVADQRLRVKS